MNSRISLRIGLGIALAIALAASAFAQYSGGTMGSAGGTTSNGVYTAPKGGYSSSTGIAVGAAVAAGAGLAYFALRNRGSLTGCVQKTGDTTKLIAGKGSKAYTLDESGLNLTAGDRVKLKGKKAASSSGGESFTATKLVKDYGACNEQAAVSQTPAMP
ncbi:MAG TPA: hypothetical protein VGX94_17555 [Terriglobia bacterium]|nr:hypothetical protein [Terriglobia bacterium]